MRRALVLKGINMWDHGKLTTLMSASMWTIQFYSARVDVNLARSYLHWNGSIRRRIHQLIDLMLIQVIHFWFEKVQSGVVYTILISSLFFNMSNLAFLFFFFCCVRWMACIWDRIRRVILHDNSLENVDMASDRFILKCHFLVLNSNFTESMVHSLGWARHGWSESEVEISHVDSWLNPFL